MISREPTLERLAIARSLLLEPFGLTDATLAKALQAIATHRIASSRWRVSWRRPAAGAS